MIARIMHVLVTIVASVCVATVLAAVILGTYYTRTWQLDRRKLIEMLAIAQGTDLESLVDAGRTEREPPSTEQPSYEQILEVRAVKTRNLELRENALKSGLLQFQTEQRKLAEEQKRVEQLQESFRGQLLAMEKGTAAAGRDNARRTLQTLKPQQAKELIAQMLASKELDEVVVLLTGMPEGKRAKILAEFQTENELVQVGELLRRIRQGLPLAAIPDNTQRQLEPPKGPGP